MFSDVRGVKVAVTVLAAATCVWLLGCDLSNNPAALFTLMGIQPPPAGAMLRQWVAGGDDQFLVFARIKGTEADLFKAWAGDAAAGAALTTEIVVLATADDAIVQSAEVPFWGEFGTADGRWVVLQNSSVPGLYTVDLNSGSPANVFDALDGTRARQVLGLNAGRLLLQTFGADTEQWSLAVVDLATGERTELGAEYAQYGAIDRQWVALLYTPGLPPQVPLDGGEPVPGSEVPPDDAASPESRIDLINLADGTRTTIASGLVGASASVLANDHVVWRESSFSQNADMSAPQDYRITLRAYDLQTGQTAEITQLNGTAGGVAPSVSFGAVGAAGIVISHVESSSNQLNRHVRNELRGWDGSTVVIQEFDASYQNPGYYEMAPAIVVPRVIYREPYTGEWSVYDSTTQERATISPF